MLSNDLAGLRICKSIAPSIYGHANIKTGIALAMFGGQVRSFVGAPSNIVPSELCGAPSDCTLVMSEKPSQGLQIAVLVHLGEGSQKAVFAFSQMLRVPKAWVAYLFQSCCCCYLARMLADCLDDSFF